MRGSHRLRLPSRAAHPRAGGCLGKAGAGLGWLPLRWRAWVTLSPRRRRVAPGVLRCADSISIRTRPRGVRRLGAVVVRRSVVVSAPRIEEYHMIDHRKLGRELGLFHSHPLVGAGLPLWLPDGAAARHAVEQYVREVERRAGYRHVYSPRRDPPARSRHTRRTRCDRHPPTRRACHRHPGPSRRPGPQPLRRRLRRCRSRGEATPTLLRDRIQRRRVRAGRGDAGRPATLRRRRRPAAAGRLG